MPDDWTADEVEAVVDAYFWMLARQVAGEPFKKSRVIETLRFGPLSARNVSAVSRKFSNISAVLTELSAPTVMGYAPLPHIQRRLRDRVLIVAKSRGLLALRSG